MLETEGVYVKNGEGYDLKTNGSGLGKRGLTLETEGGVNRANTGGGSVGTSLAYTKHCFVSGLLCTNLYYSLRTPPFV